LSLRCCWHSRQVTCWHQEHRRGKKTTVTSSGATNLLGLPDNGDDFHFGSALYGGSNDVTVSVTALNEDGTTNTDFRRAAKLNLTDKAEKRYGVSPSKTPDITEGAVTLSGTSLPAVPTGEYAVFAVDGIGDGEGDDTSDTAEAADIECTLTGPDEELFKDAVFSMSLTVTKTDQTFGTIVGDDAYLQPQRKLIIQENAVLARGYIGEWGLKTRLVKIARREQRTSQLLPRKRT
jgi:hypothetical protein